MMKLNKPDKPMCGFCRSNEVWVMPSFPIITTAYFFFLFPSALRIAKTSQTIFCLFPPHKFAR